MELRPLPLPLFDLFAERGQSFFFRHVFPSDYSLRAMLARPFLRTLRGMKIRDPKAPDVIPVTDDAYFQFKAESELGGQLSCLWGNSLGHLLERFFKGCSRHPPLGDDGRDVAVRGDVKGGV